MSDKEIERRKFIKSLLAGIPLLALDWGSFPKAQTTGDSAADPDTNQYDAVIIGAGLGGLSCAAAFARQGFKPLVLEQHYRAGGYATTFKRPGGFVFDASLHSTVVGERDGIHNLIPGFPEITDVEFVPHPNLYRAIYPDYDFTAPHKDLPAHIKMLKSHFPEEAEAIDGIYADMQGIAADVGKLSSARGEYDMSKFPFEYPHLFNAYSKTWGQIIDPKIKNPKLKAIINAQWAYYGLPPSKLASIYFAMPTISYLNEGGFYPIGKSQKMSDAMVKFIEERGGKVMLQTKVEEILIKEHAAYGVKTDDGSEYTGKVVVSNANAYDTFHAMMQENEYLKDYLARMDTFSVSLSSFQVFLGLKKDLVGEVGIKDSEIFYATGYDVEAEYKSALNADMEGGGYCLTLYDNIYEGYSPKGKNTITIITLQGFDHWKKYEADYWKGNKAAYLKEKERMADVLIDKVEKTLLPGLREAIEIREIGTPLTNVRYTGNYRGAIYGWDQTLDNSMPRRLPHTTPIENLYLSGAWTSPGGGYGGVLWSGLECFGKIMKKWQ